MLDAESLQKLAQKRRSEGQYLERKAQGKMDEAAKLERQAADQAKQEADSLKNTERHSLI
jgi:hypothetical protein